jgi:hypothetical protein
LPVIAARPGLYLTGKVRPPLSDVKIEVLFEGSDQVVVQTFTSSDGTYRAGPLYDDKEYFVSASLSGYNIKQSEDDPLRFNALKLGQIHVHVREDEKVLPGVLISLSSSEGYINNSVTDQNGTFIFEDLIPEEYYIRPLLKEYEFNPTFTSLTLKEGEVKNAEFISKRNAFSCFGKVLSLNGQPLKHIPIEAIGIDNSYEETLSDIKGSYRLRGLIPDVEYQIRIRPSSKTHSGYISRSEPSQYQIKMTQEDIYDIQFITFQQTHQHDLKVKVDAPVDVGDTLTTEIRDQDGTLVATRKPFPNHFFIISGLRENIYTVSLKTTLSPKEFNYTLPSETIDMRDHKQRNGIVVLQFVSSLKSLEAEMDNSSFITLLFFCTITALVYYRKTSIDMIRKWRGKIGFWKTATMETNKKKGSKRYRKK